MQQTTYADNIFGFIFCWRFIGQFIHLNVILSCAGCWTLFCLHGVITCVIHDDGTLVWKIWNKSFFEPFRKLLPVHFAVVVSGWRWRFIYKLGFWDESFSWPCVYNDHSLSTVTRWLNTSQAWTLPASLLGISHIYPRLIYKYEAIAILL